MDIVHGRKFGTRNKTKCNQFLGKIPIRDALRTVGTKDIDLISCAECIKQHKPGKV